MEVKINGVEYVPKASVPELADERLRQAMMHLTEMLHFKQEHKMRGLALDTLRALAPEMAELAEDDPKAAYDRAHAHDPFFAEH